MNTHLGSRPALPACRVEGLRAVEVTSRHEAALQRLFERNPQYFIAVDGDVPGPTTAADELAFVLPDGWSFTRKWLIGYEHTDGELAAIASLISDLLAPGVWHLGLLLVEDRRHGRGQSRSIYSDLEAWAVVSGAQWMRLGVVRGNARAERFWEAAGYRETRTREGVAMGRKVNTLRVMVKPLAGGELEDYLSLMPRDRPELSH